MIPVILDLLRTTLPNYGITGGGGASVNIGIRVFAATTAAAAIVAIAGCGTAAPTASSVAPLPRTPSRSVIATPREVAPGITLAPRSGLAVGPFKITPLYCGHFSKAQQTAYADYSGLIFRYTNVSTSVVGAPVLSVNFIVRMAVTGSNVNGAVPPVGPGQSATGDVGAVGGSGQSLRFTSCELMSYTVTDRSGVQPTTYAP